MSINWEQHFRQMEPGRSSPRRVPRSTLVMMTKNRRGQKWDFGSEVPPEESQFGGILTPDDLRAIRDYFGRTIPVTPEAAKIKADFVKWYDSLGPFEVYAQSTYDLARNQRNVFNLANVRTPEERIAIEDIIRTGISTEQTRGEPDRRLPDGMLPGPTKPPLKIPTYVWIVVGVAAGVIILFIGLRASAKIARIANPVF